MLLLSKLFVLLQIKISRK